LWGVAEGAIGHNGTTIDWNGDSLTSSLDIPIARATGVFWRVRNGSNSDGGSLMSFGYIAGGDGESNTLLLSENINARRWHSSSAAQLGDIGFGIEYDPTSATIGSPGPPPQYLAIQSTFTAGRSMINQDISTATQGAYPRPSSYHPGQVMVAFCDGHAEGVSDRIDQGVYARMFTPNGQRHGQVIDTNQ